MYFSLENDTNISKELDVIVPLVIIHFSVFATHCCI